MPARPISAIARAATLPLALLLAATSPLQAQRHGRSSPATAPAAPPSVAAAPLEAVSSGLGAIQFVAVNYGVPAPQSLTRQLRFDDDRTRAAALSAIGAPGQYLQHGKIPMPRAIDLQLATLGNNDDLDALLTVELDQHLVTAVLIPVDGNWKRIATLIFPTPFYDPSTTPSTWVRTARSLTQPDRYRAVFHASSGNMRGNFAENEAHLRIINGKATITMSFESTARDCSVPTTPQPRKAPQGGCNITHRWFQPDPADPTHRATLITASGHVTPREAAEPLANSRTVLESHLRTFACQDFAYNEGSQHYDPASQNLPCPTK